MAKVSLSQAAKDTEVSLPTLSRWRKNGKISADKNGSGGYIIDTSEYDRIAELKKQSRNMKGVTKPFVKDIATPNDTPNEMKVLQVEVEVLRERIKDKDLLIEDIREDRNEWKKQAQTLLLQNPVRSPEKPLESKAEISATYPHDKVNNPYSKQNFERYSLYFLLLATLLIIGGIFWILLPQSHSDSKTIAEERASSPALNLPYSVKPKNPTDAHSFSFQQQF